MRASPSDGWGCRNGGGGGGVVEQQLSTRKEAIHSSGAGKLTKYSPSSLFIGMKIT